MNLALPSVPSLPGAPALWARIGACLSAARLGLALPHPSAGAVQCVGKNETLTLRRRSGSIIECLSGTVWVTVDREPRDVILEAGQSFRIDSRQRTLVHGLDPSQVRIQA